MCFVNALVFYPNHKCNHPMEPWDASPLTLENLGTKRVWSLQLL